MPHTMYWYIPDEIYYVHFTGTTTIEELREFLAEAEAFIDSSPRDLVHSILDVGDVVESPPVLDTIKLFSEVRAPKRAVWTITIREKSVLIKLASTLGSSLINTRFRAFATLDDAIKHLKSIDESLSWDKVMDKFPRVVEG